MTSGEIVADVAGAVRLAEGEVGCGADGPSTRSMRPPRVVTTTVCPPGVTSGTRSGTSCVRAASSAIPGH